MSLHQHELDELDMSEVLAEIDAAGDLHDSSDSQSTPMNHEQIVDLLVKERDYYQEESHKDREALKTIMALCKQKGFDPFGETADPLAKPISALTREELKARNDEATVRIAKTRHVTSPDQIPMPTAEEQAKLYKENDSVNLILDLMAKSKEQEKARIAAKTPKKPWWKMIFASSHDPYDPYNT